jgi:hypothetical protein
MKKWKRTVGQVLLAVGGVLALGGIASLFFPNVELRYFGNVVSSDQARLTWIAVTLVIAVSGIAVLRGGRGRGAG